MGMADERHVPAFVDDEPYECDPPGYADLTDEEYREALLASHGERFADYAVRIRRLSRERLRRRPPEAT